MDKMNLSRTEVAEYLGVSARTIHNLMKNEGLPHYKVGKAKTSKVVFPKNLVDQWQERRCKEQAKRLQALSDLNSEVRTRPRRSH